MSTLRISTEPELYFNIYHHPDQVLVGYGEE